MTTATTARQQQGEAPALSDVRLTEQGSIIDAALIRGFAKRALGDDAVADEVDELLFDHVVESRLHPSVVAATLPQFLNEILHAMTGEDWQMVADELIAEARAVDGRKG